jgi:hypothetical protein
MIYSRWKPDGGYEYYATTERRALGTDLPTPRLAGLSPIGVASTDIGRSLPAGARPAGAGPLAKGQVIPMASPSTLGTVSASATDLALLTLAALFGWWVRGALAKELA